MQNKYSKKYSIDDIKTFLNDGDVDRVYSLIRNDLSPEKWTDKIELSGDMKVLSPVIAQSVKDAYSSDNLQRREKINAIESFFDNASRLYPMPLGNKDEPLYALELLTEDLHDERGKYVAGLGNSLQEPGLHYQEDIYSGNDAQKTIIRMPGLEERTRKKSVRGAFKRSKDYLVKGIAAAAAGLIITFSPGIGKIDFPRSVVSAQNQESSMEEVFIKKYIPGAEFSPNIFESDAPAMIAAKSGSSQVGQRDDFKSASAEGDHVFQKESIKECIDSYEGAIKADSSAIKMPYDLSESRKAFVKAKEDSFIEEIERGEYFCLLPSAITDVNRSWEKRNGPTGFIHSILDDEARCRKASYDNALWALQGWDRISEQKIYSGEDRVRVVAGDKKVTAGQDGFLDDFRKDLSLEEIAGIIRLPNSLKHNFNPVYLDESCGKGFSGVDLEQAPPEDSLEIAAEGWNEKYYGLKK